MLTIEDCMAFCELREDEVAAIAEHEHISTMAALEMGNYLVQTASGEKRIRAMIRDDIRSANERGDVKHAAMLKLVLKHYLDQHAATA